MIHPSKLTIALLAAEARMTPRELVRAAQGVQSGYGERRQSYDRRKKKWRWILPPTRRTKRLLRRVHKALQGVIAWLPCVHAGPRHRSCQTATRPHLGKSHMVVRDIHQCYPSISGEMLTDQLRNLGVPRGVARLLVALAVKDGQLPQGSPLSATVLNLFMWRADVRLLTAMPALNATYVRYADDMVVSTDEASRIERIGCLLDQVIHATGLRVSEKKRFELTQRDRDAVILGVKVNNHRGTMCPRNVEIEAITEGQKFVRGCKVASAASLVPLARRRARLEGLMHHLRQMDFSPARRLRTLIEQGDRWILLRLARAGLRTKHGKWWLHPPKQGQGGNAKGVCVSLARAWAARCEHSRAET